jgi:hypothetical protein
VKTIFLLTYTLAWLHGFAQPGVDPELYTRVGTYDSGTNCSSFFINPARLGVAESISASLYAEQRFMLAALSRYQMAAAIPVAPGSFGISGGLSGNAGYRHTQLGLAYARSLGALADVGVRFNYAQQKTTGYRSAGFVSFEVGALVRINDQLAISLHVMRQVPAFAKHEGAGLTSSYTIGFGYRPSPAVVVVAEMIRKEALPVSMHTALRYRFERRLQATIGIDAATATYYVGGGIALGALAIEVVSSFHPLLGPSPALMISFQRP